MRSIDYSEYPDNWLTEIRPAILERAGHKCEWCGVPNYAHIMRSKSNPEAYLVLHEDGIYYTQDGQPVRLTEIPDDFWQLEDTKVILTIAHVYDKDKMNVDPDNLAALCQRCHLNHDRDHHIAKRRQNRLRT